MAACPRCCGSTPRGWRRRRTPRRTPLSQPAAPVTVTSLPVLHEPATCASAGTCKASQGGGKTEYEQIVEAMERSGWVQAKAARILNMTPRQIGYALRKHNIPIKKF